MITICNNDNDNNDNDNSYNLINELPQLKMRPS